MHPEITPCQEREILGSRYQADLRIYSDAVTKLASCVPEQSELAFAESELARLAFERAFTALYDHITAHGCC